MRRPERRRPGGRSAASPWAEPKIVVLRPTNRSRRRTRKRLSTVEHTNHPLIHGDFKMNQLASHQIVADGDAADRQFLPGMGRDWLLPLYDPFTRLIGIEPAHRKLVEQAELGSAKR